MKRLFIILAGCALLAAGCCQGNAPKVESENPVIDAIMARRSIRKYKDTPVDRELLQQIAVCGINAPNAMNKQDWEVRIVDDKAFLDSVPWMPRGGESAEKAPNAFYDAPAVFFIACPKDANSMQLQNVGLMSENICLAAYSLGLGTCIMAFPAMTMNANPDAKPMLDALGFSEGYELQITIACGYPDDAPAARPRDESKFSFIDFAD